MRSLLKSSARWLRAGWFWPLALLALPTCTLDFDNAGPMPQAFDPGQAPKTSAVMCDIPTVESIESELCATTDEEEETGIPIAEAAIALRNGQASSTSLDYSNLCANGRPRKTLYHGPYPDGRVVCLNCGTQITEVYGNGDEVCIALCQDLIESGEGPLPIGQSVLAFCQANARVSTNFDTTMCFENACNDGGTPLPEFVDPRRTPEDVIWVNTIRTAAVGGTLTRNVASTDPDVTGYNAGAASLQLMTERDGWVEFEAGQTAVGLMGVDHVIGLSSTPCDPPCDEDPSLNDIEFGISLNVDGRIYLIENGKLVTNGPELNGSYGTYTTNERYRVAFKDNFDGTATISHYRVNGPCQAGQECSVTLLATHAGPGPAYPLRVDASFHHEGASLVNVSLVRIR